MTSALLILPTYNERDNIESIVARILEADERLSILVVDDGSPDGTGEIADAIAKRESRVTVLHRPGKLGLGSAYLRGFEIAIERGFDYAFEFDADGSHPTNKLSACIDALDNGADLVIGTRWMPGGKTENWPVYRQFISRGASLYSRIMLRSKLRDLTAGFRGYRTTALQESNLHEVKSAGYCFQIETAWLFERLGYHVVEVPIMFVERQVGVSKMSVGIIIEALWRVAAWGIGLRLADLDPRVSRR